MRKICVSQDFTEAPKRHFQREESAGAPQRRGVELLAVVKLLTFESIFLGGVEFPPRANPFPAYRQRSLLISHVTLSRKETWAPWMPQDSTCPSSVPEGNQKLMGPILEIDIICILFNV
jgi:hypothetical protein